MKTLRLIPCAAMLLFAFACTKEADPDRESAEAVPTIEFSVSGDDVDGDELRTHLGTSKKILWDSGDCVSVFDSKAANNKFTVSKIATDARSAKIKGAAASSTTYYALYPWWGISSSTSGGANTSFPPEQFAVKGSFGQGANMAFAKSETAADGSVKFALKQVGAFIKFTFSGNSTITSIRFRAIGGEKMAGYGTVKPTDDGSVSLKPVSGNDAVSEVLLLPAKGKTYIEPGTYEVVTLPANFTKGLNIYFTSGTGDDECVCLFKTDAFEVARNNVATLKSEIVLPDEASGYWRRQHTLDFTFRVREHLLDDVTGSFVNPITNVKNDTVAKQQSGWQPLNLADGNNLEIYSGAKNIFLKNFIDSECFDAKGSGNPQNLCLKFPALPGMKITRIEVYSSPVKYSDTSRKWHLRVYKDNRTTPLDESAEVNFDRRCLKHIWNLTTTEENTAYVIRETASGTSTNMSMAGVIVTYSGSRILDPCSTIPVMPGRSW